MLEIKNLTKTYIVSQRSIKILDDFNLDIKEGEFVSIWGPNGCGKTSLLNIIAGIVKPDCGGIEFNKKLLNSLETSFVFQDYRNSLFPWLKVKDNISFPLKLRGAKKDERNSEVVKICEKLGQNFNLESFPYELSGGQQQFISLLRGLIINPKVCLLDEPFSSLDYQTTLFIRTYAFAK